MTIYSKIFSQNLVTDENTKIMLTRFPVLQYEPHKAQVLTTIHFSVDSSENITPCSTEMWCHWNWGTIGGFTAHHNIQISMRYFQLPVINLVPRRTTMVELSSLCTHGSIYHHQPQAYLQWQIADWLTVSVHENHRNPTQYHFLQSPYAETVSQSAVKRCFHLWKPGFRNPINPLW